jgi:hypothetical protein
VSDEPLDLSLLAAQATTGTAVFAPDPEPVLDPSEAPDYREETTPAAGAASRPAPPRRGRRATSPPRSAAPPRASSPAPGAPLTPDEARRFVKDDTEHYRPGLLVKPLQDLYAAAGTVTLPFNAPVGTALLQNAETCAISLDNAAKQDPRIRKALMSLVKTSVWGPVIAAHMPIAMALAMTISPAAQRAMHTVTHPQNDGETVNPVSNGWVAK